MQSPIIDNGFAFRIPSIPARYRANCSKEFGFFVNGDTKGMSSSKAEKAGLTKGSYVEMTVCKIKEKILTFEPNYINEPFTEIWGIPVAGEMKTQFHEKCSELSTFLVHRQSMTRINLLIEEFSREAFNTWVEGGMKENPSDFALSEISKIFATKIFRFEFVQKEGKYGVYYFISCSVREAETDFEIAALSTNAKIVADKNACIDPMIEQNHKKSVEALNLLIASEQAQLKAGN
ncbi:MAG TPA: hypothetical protein DEP38_15585 [Cyanobacteria bacterium UBA9226]|nr:hypothetical protein [Cyanobacteria bacterium UBA9226]